MTKLTELKTRLDAARKQVESDARAAFKEAYQEIFERYPAVQSFSWAQYTPYFNDGEECVFRVNNDPKINGADEYDNESKDIPQKAYLEIRAMLDELPSETMKAVFGDHVEIIVSRAGEPRIEEYSHD